MIHNFGKVYHGSHPNKNSFILQFIHDDLHNSFITLRIDASDIAFVKSVSSGRIVETHTTRFIAGTTSGSLSVEIVNTGEISSEYTVSVTNCSGNMFRIPDQKLTLEPGVVKNVTFMLRSAGKKGGKKECQGTCGVCVCESGYYTCYSFTQSSYLTQIMPCYRQQK